jgi:hypothetical protein
MSSISEDGLNNKSKLDIIKSYKTPPVFDIEVFFEKGLIKRFRSKKGDLR